MNKKNLFIIIGAVVLVIIVVVICVVAFNKNEDAETTDNESKETMSTSDELLELSYTYYEEASKMAETINYKPYCNVSDGDLDNANFTNFKIKPGSGQTLMYYKSPYKNLSSLKKYYKGYLKDDYVKKIFSRKKEYKKEDLKAKPYADFIKDNGSLYCRYHIVRNRKEKYTYELDIDNYTDKKVILNLTEKIMKNNDNPCRANYSCSEKDYNTKTSKFVIEKKNGNWKVTKYYLFD